MNEIILPNDGAEILMPSENHPDIYGGIGQCCATRQIARAYGIEPESLRLPLPWLIAPGTLHFEADVLPMCVAGERMPHLMVAAILWWQRRRQDLATPEEINGAYRFRNLTLLSSITLAVKRDTLALLIDRESSIVETAQIIAVMPNSLRQEVMKADLH